MSVNNKEMTSLLNQELSLFITQYDYLIPTLLAISARLQTINRCEAIRKKNINARTMSKFFRDYSTTLSDTMAQAQNEEITKLSESIDLVTDKDTKVKNDIMALMRNIISLHSKLYASFKCSSLNAREKYGACQEISTLAASYLMTYFGMGKDRLLDIEIIGLRNLATKKTHCFVVINRDRRHEIELIKAWGENCLVFDPQQQWVATISNLPVTATLKTLRDQSLRSEILGFSLCVMHDNILDYDSLAPYKQHHRYGKLVTLTDTFFTKALENLTQIFKDSLNELGFDKTLLLEATESTSDLVAEVEYKSDLVAELEKLSGLSFKTWLDRDGYAHCGTELPDETSQASAQALISKVHYGRIVEHMTGATMIFFPRFNSNDDCKTFRDVVQQSRTLGI